MKNLTVMIIAASWLVACDVQEPTATDLVASQTWSESAGESAGLPIGERQVELEMGDAGSRDDALERLQRRKRVVAKAFEKPPRLADLSRRQATVTTYLLNELKPREGVRKSLGEERLAPVRAEVEAKLRKPRGFVATIVRLRSESLEPSELLARGDQLAESLGADPSDDVVQKLEEQSGDEIVVEVEYGVPFASVVESQRRPGWAQVSNIGAAEVESLPAGRRVTSAYGVGNGTVEFMVKLDEIPAEEADEAEVERLLEERIEQLGRGAAAKRRVDELVEDKPWTIYPEVVEDEMEVE
jgi:hypothetical protein